jgi:hypothetical protein
MSIEETSKLAKSLRFLLQQEQEMMAWYRYADSRLHEVALVSHLMEPIQVEIQELSTACEQEMTAARATLHHNGSIMNLPGAPSDTNAPQVRFCMTRLKEKVKDVVRRVDSLLPATVRLASGASILVP